MEERGVGRYLSAQDLLGQRRPLVGTVRLFADQDDAAVETLLPERFDGPATGQARADDGEGRYFVSSSSPSSGLEEQPHSSQNCIRSPPLHSGRL
jgi:hypothetical protein